MSKNYLTELPEVPDCSAVSQLPAVNDVQPLSAADLILVSQPTIPPNAETTTGYISKFAKIQNFNDYFVSSLSIDDIQDKLSKKLDISAILPIAVLSCNVENPYIISSLMFDGLRLSSVSGYKLITGLSTVLDTQIPTQIQYQMSYDPDNDRIVLRNKSGPSITSDVAVSAIMGDFLADNTLSNVTIDSSGKKLYLHFVVGNPPKLRIIEVNTENLVSYYDFTNGLASYSPRSSLCGHISVEIADLGVTTNKINTKAVTTGKIADKAVNTNKIADNAVNYAKLTEDLQLSIDTLINTVNALSARLSAASYIMIEP